jgi:hypothetical protein
MNSDLPTARDYLKSNVRLVIWCKSCRHQREIEFQIIIDQGKGDVPIVCLKVVCKNCVSRLTDCAVSGSRLRRRGSRLEPAVSVVVMNVRLAGELARSYAERCVGVMQ